MHRRYGLLGPNGCGKSSLLKALGNRELPIPDHIDIHFLDREVEASDQTALQAVMSVDTIKGRLEAEAEKLLEKDDAESQQLLEDIYERYAPHQVNRLHLMSACSHPRPMLRPVSGTLTHPLFL
jgi:ATPase subunit of ABC transporter with duplicated ATPase domains